MKRKIHILLGIVVFFGVKTNAQSLEWTNIFDTHSAGGGAGITPSSLIDNTGKITSVIVESDTLRLYQTTGNGTIVNLYNSNKNIIGNATPLIKTGQNEQALVYKTNPVLGTFRLLQTDADLNVTRDVPLILPSGITFPSIRNLIEYDDELYLTMTGNGNHYLLKINDDDTLSVVYNGSISSTLGEDYVLLDDGNIIFSYKNGNGHIIRCVSIENETIVWEESIDTGFGILMDYRIVKNGNILYTIGKERKWVDGSAVDKLTISHIDVFSGDILFQQPLNLPSICSNCGIGLNNFVYNDVNNLLYISYQSGFPQPAVLLMEVNSQTAEILNEVYFPFQPATESFPLERSVTHIKPDGSLVFVYKSYKNATEQMNLYITPLNSQLESLGTFEFHIEELESIEHPTDILSYDNSRILITGVVPNKNPNISLEQAEYFMAMINTDEILSINNQTEVDFAIKIFPNPANETVTISVPENVNELAVYDTLGKVIYKENINQKEFTLNISTYQKGIYFLIFLGNQKTVKKLVVK